MTDQDLGKLIDTYTVQYERFYPHPVERVWTALTTGSSMDAWMMPANEIEAKPGGKFWMGFSQGPDAGFRGVVSEFKENALVQYDFDNGEIMRFEIKSADGGTKLVFTHVIVESVLEEMAPPGSDEPWQPGLMAGWHMMLDTLTGWLDGDPSVTAEASLERSLAMQEGKWPADMQELMERYAAKVLAS